MDARTIRLEMANAAATVADFTSGNLPKICAKTGVPTDSVARVVVTSAPGWTWILIVFGIVPFLIVRWIFSRKSVGRVPVTPAAMGRARSIRWVLFGVFVAGVALIVASFAAETVVLLLGVVLVMASLLVGWGFPGTWWIGGHWQRDWIWLTGLHPDFAGALGAQYHDLPRDQQPA
jgi:hypothetical protein